MNYFAKNQVANFNAATVISLSDAKNGANIRATLICEQILLFSHSLGRKQTLVLEDFEAFERPLSGADSTGERNT